MFLFSSKSRFFAFIIMMVMLASRTELSASVHARYTAALQAEEKQLLGNIIAVFGITFDEWVQFKNQYEKYNYSDYEKRERAEVQSRCSKEINPALKQKILAILAQSSIHRSITVLRDNSPSGSDIIALQNTLIVDEERFNRIYTQEDHVQAIIWHEITHILKEDDLIMRALEVLRDTALNSSSYTGFHWLSSWASKVSAHYKEEKWNAAIAPWYLFRERRADLMSGLANKSNAPALADVFKRFGSCASERHDQLHPCMSDRVSYMNRLASEIDQGGV